MNECSMRATENLHNEKSYHFTLAHVELLCKFIELQAVAVDLFDLSF